MTIKKADFATTMTRITRAFGSLTPGERTRALRIVEDTFAEDGARITWEAALKSPTIAQAAHQPTSVTSTSTPTEPR